MIRLISLLASIFRGQAAAGRIVDGFTFYNEVDMLELRLRYLYEHVDEFVIVEADRKFSGEPKPFMLSELVKSPRFAWAADKISVRSLRIDASGMDFRIKPEQFDRSADSWKIESQQRNAIRPNSMGAWDVLFMGDIDEIPPVSLIESVKGSRWLKFKINVWPLVCEQKFFYYNYRSLRADVWRGTVAMGALSAEARTNQAWRDKRKKLIKVPEGGWHLSYFMTPEQISDKIQSFSHQELNTEYMRNPDRIRAVIEGGKDLFERSEGITPYDPAQFPQDLRELLVRYFPC